MLNILITFLTFVLILIGIFMVLVILMQRASSDGGMGSAFGGGAAETAFGAETTNILTRATKWSAIAFFILSFVLYLLWIKQADEAKTDDGSDLPTIAMEASEGTEATAEATAEVTAQEGVGTTEEGVNLNSSAASDSSNEVESAAEEMGEVLNEASEETPNP